MVKGWGGFVEGSRLKNFYLLKNMKLKLPLIQRFKNQLDNSLNISLDGITQLVAFYIARIPLLLFKYHFDGMIAPRWAVLYFRRMDRMQSACLNNL